MARNKHVPLKRSDIFAQTAVHRVGGGRQSRSEPYIRAAAVRVHGGARDEVAANLQARRERGLGGGQGGAWEARSEALRQAERAWADSLVGEAPARSSAGTTGRATTPGGWSGTGVSGTSPAPASGRRCYAKATGWCRPRSGV